jgi:hypothetical protein
LIGAWRFLHSARAEQPAQPWQREVSKEWQLIAEQLRHRRHVEAARGAGLAAHQPEDEWRDHTEERAR